LSGYFWGDKGAAMADQTDTQDKIAQFIEDAEYLTFEMARGDAVSPEVLVKAKPLIAPLMTALLAAKSVSPPTEVQVQTLETAMVDMMAAIAPVTIQSLRDTASSGGKRAGIYMFRWASRLLGDEDELSDADRFADGFLTATVCFLLAALACTVMLYKDVLPTTFVRLMAAIKALGPVMYGGLGACVYLLRQLHKHIHERTFDRRHKPEFYSRVILGLVGGGVIAIFPPDPKMPLSMSALGFIIGYNTDLLFSLIERVSYAAFPKVPDPPAAQTAPVAPPPPPPPPLK
jgi:hypothetical protein